MDQSEVAVARKLIVGIRNGTLTDRQAIAKLHHFVSLLQEESDAIVVGNAYGGDVEPGICPQSEFPEFGKAQVVNKDLRSSIEHHEVQKRGRRDQRKVSGASPRRTNSTGFIPSIKPQNADPPYPGERDSAVPKSPKNASKPSGIAIPTKASGDRQAVTSRQEDLSGNLQGYAAVTKIPKIGKVSQHSGSLSKDQTEVMRCSTSGYNNPFDQDSAPFQPRRLLTQDSRQGNQTNFTAEPLKPQPKPKSQIPRSPTNQLINSAETSHPSIKYSKAPRPQVKALDPLNRLTAAQVPSTQPDQQASKDGQLKSYLTYSSTPRGKTQNLQSIPSFPPSSFKRSEGPLSRRVVNRSKIPSLSSCGTGEGQSAAQRHDKISASKNLFASEPSFFVAENNAAREFYKESQSNSVNLQGIDAVTGRSVTTAQYFSAGSTLNYDGGPPTPRSVAPSADYQKVASAPESPGKGDDIKRPESPGPPSPHMKRYRAKEHFTWLALS